MPSTSFEVQAVARGGLPLTCVPPAPVLGVSRAARVV